MLGENLNSSLNASLTSRTSIFCPFPEVLGFPPRVAELDGEFRLRMSNSLHSASQPHLCGIQTSCATWTLSRKKHRSLPRYIRRRIAAALIAPFRIFHMGFRLMPPSSRFNEARACFNFMVFIYMFKFNCYL